MLPGVKIEAVRARPRWSSPERAPSATSSRIRCSASSTGPCKLSKVAKGSLPASSSTPHEITAITNQTANSYKRLVSGSSLSS